MQGILPHHPVLIETGAIIVNFVDSARNWGNICNCLAGHGHIAHRICSFQMLMQAVARAPAWGKELGLRPPVVVWLKGSRRPGLALGNLCL